MENWHEIFTGKIPKENYQMQLINGEKHGLIIELSSDQVWYRLRSTNVG